MRHSCIHASLSSRFLSLKPPPLILILSDFAASLSSYPNQVSFLDVFLIAFALCSATHDASATLLRFLLFHMFFSPYFLLDSSVSRLVSSRRCASCNAGTTASSTVRWNSIISQYKLGREYCKWRFKHRFSLSGFIKEHIKSDNSREAVPQQIRSRYRCV